MRADFFHQAHLKNWESYLAALGDESQLPTWDLVALTAANEKQAQAYRYQLRLRHKLGMLPRHTEFVVVPDPEGVRVGSGGATLNVLCRLCNETQSGGTHRHLSAGRRVLILHSGGDSKRLPQYSAFGKVFSPIPRLLSSGRPSTLFDELFVALCGLPGAMAPGIVIASGDVLLLFDHTQLDLTRPGFTGVAIQVDRETASHHGVFATDARGSVRRFLHKPSIDDMIRFGAVAAGGSVPVDTGIVYFTEKTAAKMLAHCEGSDGWLSRAVEKGVAINFYGDFLVPLAPEVTYAEYLSDSSDGPATGDLKEIRDSIWHTLRGTPFYSSVMAPARFLHFGTTREYQRLITYDDSDIRALGGRRRVAHWLDRGASVAERACILHSRVGPDSIVSPGATVEFSRLGRHVMVGKDAVVSNVTVPDDTVIPESTVVHHLPLVDSGGTRHVIRFWGVDDNPKAALPNATLMGRRLSEWLACLGLTAADVWPGVQDDSARTLWDARLFPLADAEEHAWQLILPVLAAGVNRDRTSAADWPAWNEYDRVSLADSYSQADLEQIGADHHALFLDLVSAKCMDFFQGEKSVREWTSKIPTGTDMEALLASLAETALDCNPSLDNARLCFSVSSLMAMLGDHFVPERRALNDRAFSLIAGLMIAAHAERGDSCRIDRLCQSEVEVRMPVRVDFAGGWSDTPPHSLERGGTVLNAAVSIDGCMPIVAKAEKLDEPVVILDSADTGVSHTCTDVSDLLDFSNPRDPLSLHKAALALVLPGTDTGGSLTEILDRIGGGIALHSNVVLPKGTGLGTSSLLAAALVKALMKLGHETGCSPPQTLLFEAAAAVEQMLTTGGGWQDQVGGIVPGIKLTRSAPGCFQELDVQQLEIAPRIRAELDERLIILDTGQRRLAKNLLREVMGSWWRRERRTVAILGDIQMLAHEGAEAVQDGDFSALGRILWRQWELNKQLDAGTTNPLIDCLMDGLRPYMEGAKLAGAGGGGFLVGIAKQGCRSQIRRLLNDDFPEMNITYHDSAVVW